MQPQRVIDTIFLMYTGVDSVLRGVPRACKSMSGGSCHCFGRFRRFPQASDYRLEGEFGRQAMNFPIQGMIASAVSRAIAYLHSNPG